jgi:membrane complex biogenesis BtpA family protein
MANELSKLLRVSKFIIGGVHLLPLPGTPGYDAGGGMRKIIARAIDDAVKLEQGGVDAILFANESDTPYQLTVGPEIVAAFARCVTEVIKKISLPHGINMLLDPLGGISVAHATGGRFVRGYFTGSYVGDTPFMDSKGPEALRLRRNIGGEDILLLSNVTCGFGASLDPRNLEAIIHGAIVHGRIDAIVISGLAAGKEADFDTVKKASAAAHGLPVILGTGASRKNIQDFLSVVDGVIVVTDLREKGKTLNPVEPDRVKQFMKRVQEIRDK